MNQLGSFPCSTTYSLGNFIYLHSKKKKLCLLKQFLPQNLLQTGLQTLQFNLQSHQVTSDWGQ